MRNEEWGGGGPLLLVVVNVVNTRYPCISPRAVVVIYELGGHSVPRVNGNTFDDVVEEEE
jgi:hypothetical protein